MSPTAGELVTESFGYDGGRAVTAYLPSASPEAVVFTADGGWHTARLVDALEAGEAPPTLVVGVHGRDDDDGRFAEYVPGVDDDRFSAHEAFFLGEVGGWVRSHLGVSLGAQRTGVWGASLGGGSRPSAALDGRVLPSIYLVAGDQEPFFAENAKRWLDAVREAQGTVVMEVRDGDHGGAFWYEEFPRMLTWGSCRLACGFHNRNRGRPPSRE